MFQVSYFSLGTFEFLANPTTEEFYFLEINPRLQVEHTITESIFGIDLVRSQLLVSQGESLSSAGIHRERSRSNNPPSLRSLQLRITAEDVRKDWSLSVGKITSLKLPYGNGIRVDAALEVGQSVGSDFDSLLAKIIVTAQDWKQVLAKARRALSQTRIEGVKTNLEILRGIIAHPDFATKDCDTRWLEEKGAELLKLGEEETAKMSPGVEQDRADTSAVSAAASGGAPLFRKGDAWTVNLTPVQDNKSSGQESANHLQLTKIYRNDFPNALAAELTFTSTSAPPQSYKIDISSTSASGSAVTSHHRRGNPNDPRHVIIPFPGKLVEVCVDEGDMVKAEDVICVVQQMKMEIEIRAPRAGRVVWITDVEDGEEVNEGILAAEIEADGPKL
jgi:acetyl/propionyl-CoA carboxylase alpha subunit